MAREVSKLMTDTYAQATTDPDPLAALGASRALIGLLSTWEAQLVREAIADGATWEMVGGTVGVSRQAAWQRFHGDTHEFRRLVKANVQELRNRHRQEMNELRDSIKNAATGRSSRDD